MEHTGITKMVFDTLQNTPIESCDCDCGNILSQIVESVESILFKYNMGFTPESKALVIRKIFEDAVLNRTVLESRMNHEDTETAFCDFIENEYFTGPDSFIKYNAFEVLARAELLIIANKKKFYISNTKQRLSAFKQIRDKELFRAKKDKNGTEFNDILRYCREVHGMGAVEAVELFMVADAYLESLYIDELLQIPLFILADSIRINKDEVFANGLKALRLEA